MVTVRVGSWNILNRPLDYGERLTKAVDEIVGRGIDVAALQEVRLDRADMLRDLMQGHGYGSAILRGSADSPVRGTDMEPVSEDTVAIVWREGGKVRRLGDATQVGGAQMLSMDFTVRGGGVITVISYHGMWGCSRQATRLREVSTLGASAPEESDSHAVIVGGDFNAEPDERAIRYMTGSEPGVDGDDWTFWLDAQSAMESVGRCRMRATTICSGPGTDTNLRMGISPTLMPERIIDHIMTKGYRYGRPGGFSSVSVIDADFPASDHRLLVADVIAPVTAREPSRRQNRGRTPETDGNPGRPGSARWLLRSDPGM